MTSGVGVDCPLDRTVDIPEHKGAMFSGPCVPRQEYVLRVFWPRDTPRDRATIVIGLRPYFDAGWFNYPKVVAQDLLVVVVRVLEVSKTLEDSASVVVPWWLMGGGGFRRRVWACYVGELRGLFAFLPWRFDRGCRLGPGSW